MKVILTAFNRKLKSEPMDIPESGSPYFYMILEQPLTAMKIATNKEFLKPNEYKKCEFERTSHVENGARIYRLIDFT